MQQWVEMKHRRKDMEPQTEGSKKGEGKRGTKMPGYRGGNKVKRIS